MGTVLMSLVSDVQSEGKRIVQQHRWGDVVWHVWCSAGVTEKPPVVLLHGGSGSWTHWVRNVQHIAQYRPVWALDMPGFGDSALPEGVSDADDLVDYVVDILKHTFKGEAVDVLAFSFGGMTAGLVAAAYPELIRKMVLVGIPGLGLFGKVLPMRGMTPSMTEQERRDVHRHNLNAMMLAHPSSVTEEVVDLQAANVLRDRMRRRKIARTDVVLKAQLLWQCPVHGIWGAEDALYKDTLHQVSGLLHRMQSFITIPDAGHWVMFEKSTEFHQAVDTLLAV